MQNIDFGRYKTQSSNGYQLTSKGTSTTELAEQMILNVNSNKEKNNEEMFLYH